MKSFIPYLGWYLAAFFAFATPTAFYIGRQLEKQRFAPVRSTAKAAVYSIATRKRIR